MSGVDDVAQRDRVIVALDAAPDRALALAAALQGHATAVKVGMTLYYATGPAVVGRLRADGFNVFVDLKLHDIPHQVAGAAREIAALGATMMTVHAGGGSEMVRAAVEGAEEGAARCRQPRPAVLAVTVLTSIDAATLAETGVASSAREQVLRLAQLARTAGADGVVCSPEETADARRLLGAGALVVTPGIRPAGAAGDDQARVATPSAAFAQGASHIVVGRPVTAAPDPVAAFEAMVEEVEG